MVFEGATSNNGFSTYLIAEDPDQDNIITIPDTPSCVAIKVP